MSPGEFLRAVWPDDGFYCIAWPFSPEPGKTAWVHRVFDTIGEAATCALENRGTRDVYFTVHTLKERSVLDYTKLDFKTKQPGKKTYRTQDNMKCAKAFFFDIDVEPDNPKKYPTQVDAFAELKAFTQATQLPPPTVVSSGGGLHIYWIIDQSLPSEEWAVHEGRLKQLAKLHGLKVDPSRTTDTASVLRVAGTSNFKNGQIRPVDVWFQGAVSETNTLTQLISDAIVRAGDQPAQPSAPKASSAASILGSNIEREFDGSPVDLKDVGNACQQVRHLLKTRGATTQPAWYHGILNVVKYTTMGDKTGTELAHIFSQGHPGYDKDETDAKLAQLKDFAPARCETIADNSPLGEDGCKGCPFKDDYSTPNPLVAARRTARAAPIVLAIPGVPTGVSIPDPPPPYSRLKHGGISRVGKNKDGDETIETIYPYDLYPIRRLVNVENATEQHLWAVDLPRTGIRQFLLDADALYDPRKFIVSITHQGIYPHKSQIGSLQEYMTAYISELQKLVDADSQSNHLGWAKDHTQFILPDKIMEKGGTTRAVTLSLGAQRSSAQVYKKGSLAEQIRLLEFYNNPAYIGHQHMVAAGLAATAFHETGHHGVILNASGDAGASKSTALYTAAAHWGHPSLYPLNGTGSGATMRGRNERISTLANLPICVDEITHMPVKEAQDLAMGITQPGHRIRLQQDGVERASIDSHKATIMLCTANSSLHSLLSANNAAGTAGSMRVIEMQFRAQSVHKKHEADAYMRALTENFGHTGEVFLQAYLRDMSTFGERVRYWQRKIDEAANIQSAERFWSAEAGAEIATVELSTQIGLLRYDPDLHFRWFVEGQIPSMRSVVHDEYSTPLSVMADYLQEISGNTIVTEATTVMGRHAVNVLNRPHGSLLAHYDRSDNLVFVLKKGFKDYCLRVGANPNRVMHELSEGLPPIISSKNARRTLGAGTDYAKAQSWCFILNMAHPMVSGTIDLQAIGSDTQAPLRAVS